MNTTSTSSVPKLGPSPHPVSFRGSREQALAMTAEEMGRLIQSNRGYLQRRRRRTDHLIQVLFPDTCTGLSAGEPFGDLKLSWMVNQALWDAGYVPVQRIYRVEERIFLGDIFRWEFSPNWGCR